MSEQHSKLMSPSSSGLWIPCTAMPQALLDSEYVDSTGPEAGRGTIQHDVAKRVTEGKMTLASACPTEVDGEEWDQVKTAVEAIYTFLQSEGVTVRTKYLFLEKPVSFSGWRKDCFGTGDFIYFDPDTLTLYVFDYKFGRVLVIVEWNSQLLIYGLAAIETLIREGVITEVKNLVIGISQPKVSSLLQTHRLTVAEALDWDKNVLIPAQKAIVEGKGKFNPGGHCTAKYCKNARNCSAFKEQGSKDMELFVADYPVVPTKDTINSLSVMELSDLVQKSLVVEGVIKEVKDRAKSLLESGMPVPGLKLVEGRGKREWTSEDEAITFLTEQKVPDEEMFNVSVKTLPQAEKLLKKELKFSWVKEGFKKLTKWVPGSPVLALESDKRSAVLPESKKEEVEIELEKTVEEWVSMSTDTSIDDLLSELDSPKGESNELDDLLNSL
jgi:hypothetical protein